MSVKIRKIAQDVLYSAFTNMATKHERNKPIKFRRLTLPANELVARMLIFLGRKKSPTNPEESITVMSEEDFETAFNDLWAQSMGLSGTNQDILQARERHHSNRQAPTQHGS